MANEMATDPKWILIGREVDLYPSMVAGVWSALMGHASAACPRGCVSDFDVESLAAFNGIDIERIKLVLERMRARKLITEDGRLRAWEKRGNGPKADPTGAARAKRYREKRHAVTRDVSAARHAVTRDAEPRHARHDRDGLGGTIGGGSVGTASTRLEINTSNKRSVARALARDEIIEELDREKAGGKLGWTLYGSKHIGALVDAKVTGMELHAAIGRARLKRAAEGSNQAVNVGLVAAMLADIRAKVDQAAGQPPTRLVAGNSPEQPPEDPVKAATDQANHFHRLGAIDEAERDRRIAAARAKLQREVAA